MSTMVGTTVTGGNNLLYPNQLTLLGGELHPIEEPQVIFNQHKDEKSSSNQIKSK